jgi:hypothetical protein
MTFNKHEIKPHHLIDFFNRPEIGEGKRNYAWWIVTKNKIQEIECQEVVWIRKEYPVIISDNKIEYSEDFNKTAKKDIYNIIGKDVYRIYGGNKEIKHGEVNGFFSWRFKQEFIDKCRKENIQIKEIISPDFSPKKE